MGADDGGQGEIHRLVYRQPPGLPAPEGGQHQQITRRIDPGHRGLILERSKENLPTQMRSRHHPKIILQRARTNKEEY